MKQKLAVLAVALLAVTAGCTGSGLTGASAQAQDETPGETASQGQTVAITASGQVQTAPDQAVVRVATTARADSIETVRRQMAENASRLRTALREAGLEADQITSARYDIRRNHRHDERPSEPEFQGQHSFVVTVNETDRAGEIVVTAVENGATRVENVEFTITQETREDLREQALSAAVENAHGKAEVAANGTGLELADVRTVQTADVSTSSVRQESAHLTAAVNADSGGAPTSFDGGTVTVTADVVVVYDATSN